MDREAIFQSDDAGSVERAERFLRNAGMQSWRAVDADGSTVLEVRAEDAAAAKGVVGALKGFSTPLAAAGAPEAEQPFWKQPGTIPIAVAVLVLLVFVDYRWLVMFAVVAVPLLGVRVAATRRRGADAFSGPSLDRDRPRPRHRDWRSGRRD